MNTVSTDLPNEVNEQLQAMFAAAQATLRQREEDELVAQLKAEEEQNEKRQAEWAKALTLLKNRLPEWIHKYIQAPTTKYEHIADYTYETRYAFVSIEVPGCFPIAAWAECRYNSIRLEAIRPELQQDDDGVWTVASKVMPHYYLDWSDIRHGNDDIAVALFQAHDAFLQSLELAATADERNAAPKPAPVPPVPDPIDQARQLVNMLSCDDPIKSVRGDDEADFADDRTLVLASVGLAIAYHISRVADALEEKN